MVETAAHFVEHVLPEQPIRQWVLSFPYPLRFLFAARPAMLSQVLGIVYRATSTFLIRRAGLRVGAGARTGAVTLIQRFGSALNLNIHLHMFFVDGVYTFDDERPRSHRGCAPTRPELQRLLRAIAARVTRALERQGLLIRDHETASLDLEPDDGFERLLGAAVHYPITGTPTTMSIDGLFFLSVLDALAPALRYGVPVLGYDGGKFDPERSFALMEKYRVRNGFIPPTALKLMMQVPNATTRYPVSMRSIMSAGEQVGAEVVHWADEALGVKVNEMWGQTETNYLVGNCSAVMDVRPGSMGKPYPGHVVGVIDDAGDRVADGTVGELAPRRGDPVMFLGYWGREDATREKFAGDWFRTGDLGYRDSDGYYWFMGRKDDVISSAGHRVGPGEIEDCLLKHPAVRQAAVIGAPDALRGQRIKAFIVLAPGHAASAALVEDIQRSVRTRLAAHEYPRDVEFIDELPMTTTGKVRRIELREREVERARERGAAGG